jgi:hypothetical protein
VVRFSLPRILGKCAARRRLVALRRISLRCALASSATRTKKVKKNEKLPETTIWFSARYYAVTAADQHILCDATDLCHNHNFYGNHDYYNYNGHSERYS